MNEDLSESFLFSSASALPRKIRLLTGNEQRAVRAAAVEAAAKLFDDMTNVLGILQHKKAEEFPKEAVALLNERAEARRARNWARADQIREELKAMGFAVEDSKEGAKLKRL